MILQSLHVNIFQTISKYITQQHNNKVKYNNNNKKHDCKNITLNYYILVDFCTTGTYGKLFSEFIKKLNPFKFLINYHEKILNS